MKLTINVRLISLMAVLVAFTFLLGCSGGNSPTTPNTTPELSERQPASEPGERMLWGFYQVEIDPDTLEISIHPLRTAEFNANVTKFMQPPASPTPMMSVEIDHIASDVLNDLLILDVTLQHPFPGMTKFRGFDVRGIFMSDASQTAGFDSSLFYADWPSASEGVPASEPVLLNPDGYTRWWNPSEFTDHGIIFGYTHGNLAPSDFLAGATLNPYKYFCDELEADDPFDIDSANRGTFSLESGFNTRKYSIQFAGKPWQYNYAIDASWAKPDPDAAPDYAIESFPPEANCQEACNIYLSDAGSTTWYESPEANGGEFILDIEIFDWQAVGASTNPSVILDEIGSVWIESPAIDDGEGHNYLDVMTGDYKLLPGVGDISAVIRVTIAPDFSDPGIDGEDYYPAMIAVESADPDTYEPQITGGGSAFTFPDAPLTAYVTSYIEISGINPQEAPVVISVVPDEGMSDALLEDVEIHGQHFMNGATVEFSHVEEPFNIGPLAAFFADDTLLNTDLDLTDAPLGFYNVTVENPDMQSGTLEAGFEVIENLQAVLVLEEEIDFEPTHDAHDCYTPAIIVEHDNDVVFVYEEYHPTGNKSYSTIYRSKDDGFTWPEYEWGVHSSGGSWRHGDAVKLWPNSNDGSYKTMQLIDPTGTIWATGFMESTNDDGPFGIESAHVSQRIWHANEIVQDADGYVYALGDEDGYIRFKRSETPDCIDCGPGGAVWQPFPVYTLVDPGTLSRVRSSALYNGTMYLAYFEDGGDVIRLAIEGPTFDNWDTSTIIWDASDSGAHSPRDPGLQIDDTGFHVTFVRTDFLTGFNELCYIFSEDGSTGSWTEPVIIRANVFEITDSPIIHYDWDGTSTLGTVWSENEKIWAAFSIDDGATWSQPVLVSETYDQNKHCDLAIAHATDNWHFIFSAFDPTTELNRIHYRRGHMEWL